jgi:porphobilinogen synthase
MLAEVNLSVERLVAPLFVCPGEGVAQEIASMPGQYRWSVDRAVETVRRWAGSGIGSVLLFGIPDRKDAEGSAAWSDDQPVQQLTRALREALPELTVFTDTCLCEYTDHGHCGPTATGPDGRVTVDNDATLTRLARTAVSQARAGADFVAPSAMMDGQVAAIRNLLDSEGFSEVGVLSYAVKFASSFYGPFRDAAGSSPGQGDRRGYQMDPRAGLRQAMLEAAGDEAEGADVLMVKPAGAYLDVLARLRERTDLPLMAYHVSGEYSMIKAAAQAGWVNEPDAVIETMTGIRRAGADGIVTYFAEALADWLS